MPTRNATTREEIAQKALELANAEGIRAVTMRRLADRVGLPTMTLYGYFSTKDELLDAMADAAVAAAEIEPRGETWQEQIATLMDQVRELLASHPSGVHIREHGPVLGPAALRISDRALTILMDAGFSHRDAALAYRSIFLFTFGHAAFNVRAEDDAGRRRVRATLAALPPDEFPALSSGIDDHLEAVSGDAAFHVGLRALLAGLRPA